MAPYEITHAGGSVEHWNEEPGAAWMERFDEIYDKIIWLNPNAQETWEYLIICDDPRPSGWKNVSPYD